MIIEQNKRNLIYSLPILERRKRIYNGEVGLIQTIGNLYIGVDHLPQFYHSGHSISRRYCHGD